MQEIGMKFFTFNRLSGKALGIENAESEYRAYLDSVRERLPEVVKRFIETSSLKGNNITGISSRPHGNALIVSGRINQEGPVRSCPDFIALKYGGGSLSIFSNDGCLLQGTTGFGKVVQDEFSITQENTFAHNLILSSGIEICISFRGFSCLVEYRGVDPQPSTP